MSEYNFLLKFHLHDPESNPETFLDALFEAGCDDATVGVGRSGYIALSFTRKAASAQGAVTSAIRDVKKAIPHARLVEAMPDLVGVTDIADIVGCSRQYIRKIVVGHKEMFPSPIHDGTTSIWNLTKVLKWLKERGTFQIDERMIELSSANMRVNMERLLKELEPDFRRALTSPFCMKKSTQSARGPQTGGAAIKVKAARAGSIARKVRA